MSNPWFRAKAYGLGYSPASPQGWAATALAAAVIVADVRLTPPLFADRVSAALATGAIAVAVVLVLIGLCLARGDGAPMRWRWGGKPRA